MGAAVVLLVLVPSRASPVTPRAFALPLSHGLLADAQLIGELNLRESGVLAQLCEPRAKAGAGMFGRSATRMHGRIIRVILPNRPLRNKQRGHRYNYRLVTGGQSMQKIVSDENALDTPKWQTARF